MKDWKKDERLNVVVRAVSVCFSSCLVLRRFSSFFFFQFLHIVRSYYLRITTAIYNLFVATKIIHKYIYLNTERLWKKNHRV